MKITERIALEQYNFLEIEADSIEELQKTSELVRMAYANRLHKETHPAPFKDTVGDNTCDKCGSIMKTIPGGVSKKTGKPYNSFLSCPSCKATKNLPKQYFGPNA